MSAPWLKASEAVDFARSVGAPRNLAIHDRVYSEAGLGIVDGHFDTAAGRGAVLHAAAGRVRPLSAVRQPPASASRTGTNFAWDSASSASGSESATMPQPANSRTVSPSTTAERNAMPHSPSPLASIQPTGPA